MIQAVGVISCKHIVILKYTTNREQSFVPKMLFEISQRKDRKGLCYDTSLKLIRGLVPETNNLHGKITAGGKSMDIKLSSANIIVFWGPVNKEISACVVYPPPHPPKRVPLPQPQTSN